MCTIWREPLHAHGDTSMSSGELLSSPPQQMRHCGHPALGVVWRMCILHACSLPRLLTGLPAQCPSALLDECTCGACAEDVLGSSGEQQPCCSLVTRGILGHQTGELQQRWRARALGVASCDS